MRHRGQAGLRCASDSRRFPLSVCCACSEAKSDRRSGQELMRVPHRSVMLVESE
jgi:hypothetical protein